MTLTEQHSREFVGIFFSHFSTGFYDRSDASAGRAGRLRLASWLEVLAKLKNPKAIYRSDDLYTYLLALLSHGDVKLQRLALTCISTWKSPSLLPHLESLQRLLSDTHFRDELLQFSLAEDSDIILLSQRAEVVPLTIRVLYGLMISHEGRAGAAYAQSARKAAVLGALRSCSSAELDVLVDLMLRPFSDQLGGPQHEFSYSPLAPLAAVSQQVGFLSLLSDILKHLNTKIRHRWSELLEVTLNLAYHSQAIKAAEIDESLTTPKRKVRQIAIRRLADFFTLDPSYEFKRFLPHLFASLITPRLPTFAAENGQAPSALLALFTSWTLDSRLVPLLVNFDQALLPSVFDCLSIKNVKDTVIARILEIVQRTIDFSAEDAENTIFKETIQPYFGNLLANLTVLFSTKAATMHIRDTLAMQQIALLSSLAQYITEGAAASAFLPLLLPLLLRAHAVLPEKVKVRLLEVVAAVIPVSLMAEQAVGKGALYVDAYNTISSLFATMRSGHARTKLVDTFKQFVVVDSDLEGVANLLDDLNSFSPKRIEMPDFDRRLAAFSRFNEEEHRSLQATHWIPIIHTMFYFVQDPEELPIRSSANLSLRRFVAMAGASLDPELRKVLSKDFVTRLNSGLKSKSQMTRMEVLSVLAAALEESLGVAEFEDMKCLLAGGDTEANFFNNIYHIQLHRRTRAMRRLAEEAEAGRLPSSILADLFIPLLSHNLTSISEAKNAELVNETVQCIGRLAKHLQWPAYYRTLQRYLKLSNDGREGQKVFVRTSVSILKSFHFDLSYSVDGRESPLLGTVLNRLIPRLMQFLVKRDEAEEALRVPMAEGIASVVRQLPDVEQAVDVSSLITALAQILRSKAQDTRDLTRHTIVNIAALLGPSYFGAVVKELRSALARGPQLHVLAFTLHALLLRITVGAEVAEVDDCLEHAVPIIFGDLVRP